MPFHFPHRLDAERRQAERITGHHAASDLIAAIPCERHHAHAAPAQMRDIPKLPGNRCAALDGQHQSDAALCVQPFEVRTAAEHGKRAAFGLALKEISVAVKIGERLLAAHRVRQPNRHALDIRRKGAAFLHTDVQIVS